MKFRRFVRIWEIERCCLLLETVNSNEYKFQTHKNVLLLLLNVMHKRWYKSLEGLWSSPRGSRRAADIVFFLLSSPSLIRDLIGCLKSVSYLVPTKNATFLAKVVESEPEQPVILNRDSDIYFGVSPCDVTSEP